MTDVYRVTIKLTDAERAEFRNLKPAVGEAFNFWGKVAHSRGLDYSTIMYDDGFIFALPYGHGKYWCWPKDLKCASRPNYE